MLSVLLPENANDVLTAVPIIDDVDTDVANVEVGLTNNVGRLIVSFGVLLFMLLRF